MRQETITSAKAGINRYRTKGGASKETLYDFLNGFVTVAGSFRPRPGTVIDSIAEAATSLPPGTVGLTTYKDKLVVFADHDVDVSAYEGYTVELLTYPGAHLLDEPPTLVDIHFAEPFLGYLYVSAEWSNGSIFHYWLQRVSTWQPNHVYMFGELVQPSTPNGYTYRAGRLLPANPLWKPDTAYTLGFVVEPTEQNGYQYEAVELIGESPRSGTTEPDWIASPGALVNDDADFGVTVPDETGGNSTGGNLPPQEVIDRYGLGPQAPTNREEQ